jgi:hypothetical protein
MRRAPCRRMTKATGGCARAQWRWHRRCSGRCAPTSRRSTRARGARGTTRTLSGACLPSSGAGTGKGLRDRSAAKRSLARFYVWPGTASRLRRPASHGACFSLTIAPLQPFLPSVAPTLHWVLEPAVQQAPRDFAAAAAAAAATAAVGRARAAAH